MNLLLDEVDSKPGGLSAESNANDRLAKLEERYNNLLRRFELHLSLVEKIAPKSNPETDTRVENPESLIKCEKCEAMFDPMTHFKMLTPGADRKQYIVTFCTHCNHRYVVEIPVKIDKVRNRTIVKRILFAIVICLVGECFVVVLFDKMRDDRVAVYESGIISIIPGKESKLRESKLKQLDEKMDSISNVKVRKYEARIDSISKAEQIELLEKALEVQNSKYTLYGLIVAIIAAAAGIFGVKFNSVRHRKRYKLLEERIKEIDQAHKAAEHVLKSTIMNLENEIVNLNSRDKTFDKRLMRLSLMNKKDEKFEKTNKKRKRK